MNLQIKYQTTLDKVSEVLPLLSNEAQKELQTKSVEFMNEVHDSQYIKVPLVGVFSAGKSSLLNAFAEKPGMLPVDTLPETAVAYELYYAQTECVELYRNGNKVDSRPLTDIKQMKTEPGDIAKVFCTSEPIKKLQEKGIILVDMPGIGSGIERHDAAIFNYVHSGTAFVLVVDAEQGSLRGSSLAFMQELSQYNMCPVVLVSKIDKKPESEVKDIVEYIQYQLTRLGNNNPYVGTVCAVNNDFGGLRKYLDDLNPEVLVAEKFGKKLKLLINSIIEQIKVRIDLRTQDIANVDEKIKKIDEEISNTNAELPTCNSNADTPEKSTEDVLNNVRKALDDKSSEIADMIVNKEDIESIKSVIVSTIRTAIISALKEESEQYSAALGSTINESVSNLSAIEISSDVVSDFSEIIDNVKGFVEVFLSFGGIWSKLAAVLLPFLPKIVNWLYGKSDEEVHEEVRIKFMNVCNEQIIGGIRPTIYKITEDNQKRIQEKLQAEHLSKLEKIKEGLREKIADENKSKEEVETEISKLTSAISHLNVVISEI